MIKVECDRCGKQKTSDGRVTTIGTGIFKVSRVRLPDDWVRLTVPSVDERCEPDRPELCPECATDVREFLVHPDAVQALATLRKAKLAGELDSPPPAAVDCPDCGDAFEPQQLAQHRTEKHGVVPDEGAVCRECGKPILWDQAARLWKHRSVKDAAGVGYGHDIRPVPANER